MLCTQGYFPSIIIGSSKDLVSFDRIEYILDRVNTKLILSINREGVANEAIIGPVLARPAGPAAGAAPAPLFECTREGDLLNREESVDLCLKDNVYVVWVSDNCNQNGYVRTRCFKFVLSDLVLLVIEAIYSLKMNVKRMPPSPECSLF